MLLYRLIYNNLHIRIFLHDCSSTFQLFIGKRKQLYDLISLAFEDSIQGNLFVVIYIYREREVERERERERSKRMCLNVFLDS